MEPIEVHTSELMDACPRRAKLRIGGKEHAIATKALVRGQAVHAALETAFAEGWEPDRVARFAWDATMARLRDEKRTPEASAIEAEDEVVAYCAMVLAEYERRLLPATETQIGCEIPVRMTIDVDGEPVTFASHIDRVFIGADYLTGERAIIVEDWKSGQEQPSSDYLARNLQLGMYQHAVKCGAVDHPALRDSDGWPRIELPVRCYWVHLNNLEPYKRAGTRTEDGETVKYTKGDERPLRRVVFDATCNNEEKLLAEFGLRVRMMRADLWPAIPEPSRCWHQCQSQYACNAWGNHGD